MNTKIRASVLITAAITVGALPISFKADHIPGHDNCDPTFPMPIPGQEFFSGGVLFVTLIGPVEDSIITNTTFDITYVSDGATPASEIQLHGTILLNGSSPGFIVTGKDLGFGSGPGTFKGIFETDALNGIAAVGFFPPYSIVDLQIDAINGGIQGTGYFVDSFITCDVIPAPPCVLPCPADLDGDGTVNTSDLLELFAVWGTNPHGPPDFDGDGIVNTTDLLILFANWGSCP